MQGHHFLFAPTGLILILCQQLNLGKEKWYFSHSDTSGACSDTGVDMFYKELQFSDRQSKFSSPVIWK